MTAVTEGQVRMPTNSVEADLKNAIVIQDWFVKTAVTPGQAACFVSGAEDQIEPSDTGSSSKLAGVVIDNLLTNTSTGKPYGRTTAYPTNVKARVVTSNAIVKMTAGAAGCTAGTNVIITTAAGVVVDGAGTAADLGLIVGRALNTAASGADVLVSVNIG